MAIAPPPRAAGSSSPHTRQDALALAKLTYRILRDRVSSIDSVSPEYVESLVTHWDDRLEYLSRFRSDAALSDAAMAAFRFLTDEVIAASSDNDVDALVRWLDGYPDAVAQLFPPSTLTFDLLPNSAEPSHPDMGVETAAA